ncbi:MAG: KGG domain-containing protein [Candidatus Yanofskybacteria bacterium]|nr:KGG domain-containing protein [Candidatus Yanofskybacteria bacterium]
MADTSKRGFASMDPEKQREIAKKGGEASHEGGFASMDPEKQREIARKGGEASRGGRRKSSS